MDELSKQVKEEILLLVRQTISNKIGTSRVFKRRMMMMMVVFSHERR